MTHRTAMAAFRCFAPNDGAGSGGAGGGAGSGEGDKGGAGGQGGSGSGAGGAATFEDWHKGLDDAGRAHIESHVTGLKSALDAERSSKKDLEKQIRELAGKADKGSDFEKQLNETADKLATEERRANFYELAHAAGVKNLKLAWTVANTDQLFKRDGSPDIEAIKKDYPELFASTTTTNAGAGAGSGQGGGNGQSMNDLIRTAAGRKV